MTGAPRPYYKGANNVASGQVLPPIEPLQYGLGDPNCHVDRTAFICDEIPDLLYCTVLDDPLHPSYIGKVGAAPRQPAPDRCRWVGTVSDGVTSVIVEQRTDNDRDPTGNCDLRGLFPVTTAQDFNSPVQLVTFHPFYAEYLSRQGVRYAFSSSPIQLVGPDYHSINIHTRPVWSISSILLNESYGSNTNYIEGIIQQTWRPLTNFSQVVNDGTSTPGSILAQFQNWDLFAISGTSNALQWYDQLTDATLPMVTGGAWSTMAAWYSSAAILSSRIPMAADFATRPLYLLGDSMGGAVACVLAQMLRDVYPLKPIKLYTQGMPKPGDDRLKWLLGDFDHARMVNAGDPVPTVPPDLLAYLGLIGLVGAVPIYFWRQYQEPIGCYVVNADGSVTQQGSAPWLPTAMLEMITDWVGGLPYFNPIPHLHGAYRTRLER